MPVGASPQCHGNGAQVCCTFGGVTCPYLETQTMGPDRYWVCGLYRELLDWDVVHADPRYAEVETLWRSSGEVMAWLWEQGIRCGDWGVPEGRMRSVKAKGNAPQVIKDFQSNLITDFNRAQQGEYVPSLCCFGNEPEVH